MHILGFPGFSGFCTLFRWILVAILVTMHAGGLGLVEGGHTRLSSWSCSKVLRRLQAYFAVFWT